MGKYHVGTSGFNYGHWEGLFYPPDFKETDWLTYFSMHFETVELNVTFYNIPSESSFKNWYNKTPKDFIFSVKGSRYITHMKKLNDVEGALDNFLKALEPLGKKAQIILWQFPDAFDFNKERLEAFCQLLSSKSKLKQAFEFRNPSFFDPECYEILEYYKFALCIADSPRWPRVEKITAPYIYLRFHGSKTLFDGSYSDSELDFWHDKIMTWNDSGIEVFAYFNNDANANAVKNAQTLLVMLNPNKNPGV